MSLKSKLSRFFGKVYEEDQGEYKLFILYERGEPRYILCFEIEDNLLVGKISLFSKAASTDCSSLEYQPEGLYIVSTDLDDFVEKLRKKAARLASLEHVGV
ncbi:hypothetical protein TCELL_0006 [Thermogladius calderae 1633]|uniref:Uncharacterized protein n=1 Tax=Thermogladius calderae (strain DSM 22663 / VKM B-2946 / 1633) TaxID=1184251 RepID=I3TCE3_THEC1|nr:hypothetical protein [Thermogladius calderae]AFK50431.1 hypothetical protein TCELL_0006 [Thermogladius calderae 1633]